MSFIITPANVLRYVPPKNYMFLEIVYRVYSTEVLTEVGFNYTIKVLKMFRELL